MKVNGKALTAGIAMLILSAFASSADAQKDTVYLNSGTSGRNTLVRGRILETSALKISVEVDGNRQEIPASRIKKISFSGEPRGLSRARAHLENSRFSDCIETLAKIDKVPDSKFIKQEIEFLKSYASAQKALQGDQEISTEAAEKLMAEFIKSNGNSHLLVKAIDLYGQLLMSNGKTALAQKEFGKLTKSRWDEYVIRGHFFEGETLIHQSKYEKAKQSYRALKNLAGTDDTTRQFQLLADCQLARIDALLGNVEPSIATLNKIIQTENADNTRLFAVAYNSLGTCYLKSNELKKACRAFLHTELLFSAESDAHAESLYNLAKIWPELKETDRANRARELLTSRYRNTIWASKL